MITVYTVILADYDNLRSPVAHSPQARWMCFTDRERHVWPWEIVPFRHLLGDDPARNVRIPKCVPHLLMDSEFSIFQDGAFRMRITPEQAAGLLGDADLALFEHPCHRSVHDERDFYQRQHGAIPEHVQAAHQRCVDSGLAIVPGEFWAGGLLIRRHTAKTAEFNELWFREYAHGSPNDQFSLWYAIKASGIKVATLRGNVIMDSRFGYCLHANSGCGDNVNFESENAAWAEKYARIRELAE